MRLLRDRILDNERQAQDSMDIAAQAKKAGKQAIITLKTRKAGRLQESNKSYKDLLRKMEVIYRVLSKMHENYGIIIEDTSDQVQQKEIEWKTIKQAHSAMRSAMNIISGDKDKRALYEQTLDMMATDLGNKVGEMERFMELSQTFMDGVDLQNGVFEERGMEMLEKWEKNADSWLLGDEKTQIVADANDDSKILDLGTPIGRIKQAGAAQYDTLFK
jgi:hypothetical protein